MKDFIILILIAISMTFVAAKYFFESKDYIENKKVNFSEIAPYRNKILQSSQFKEKINFDSLFASSNLYQTEIGFRGLLSKLLRSKQNNRNHGFNCNQKIYPGNIPLLPTTKLFIWHNFICKKMIELPLNFFKIPPYINYTGQSFSYLAFSLDILPFKKDKWVQKNIQYFKIQELKTLRKKNIQLPQPYRNFSKLSEKELGFISSEVELFALRNFIFVSDHSKRNLPNIFSINDRNSGRYKIFEISYINKLIKKSPFFIKKYNPKVSCIFIENNMCWKYSVKYLFLTMNKKSMISFVLVLILIVITLWQLVKKLKEQKNQEEQKRLALQVLTHEFRTPISSLLLLNESISKKFNTMSEELQEDFIQMSSDIFRLQRLTETSKNYLYSSDHSRKEKIALNKIKLESIKDFVSDMIDEYNDNDNDNDNDNENEDCTYFKLDTCDDYKVLIDQYWLRTCLKNLLENSVRHGKAPAVLSIGHRQKKLIIKVKDAGYCEFEKLSELSEEFKKGNQSEGTGLGLSIVFNVMKEIGGELKYKNNPTEFCLVFNDAILEVKNENIIIGKNNDNE